MFNQVECMFQERDEINKYAYFEVLFLGREGESYVHEHRLRLLYRLALYALQHPVFQLYSQISLWLSKVRMYFALIGNNFVKCTTALQYEYLLPLETACPEFTVFFVVYATRFMPINRPMAAVFASYINANPGYFLKGFRDSPHLADIFRSEVQQCVLPIFSTLIYSFGNKSTKRLFKLDTSKHVCKLHCSDQRSKQILLCQSRIKIQWC
ncbi:unnamed protein product [Angiostrongylus costaricensis]|uniref:Helitron_like_N domain-containing protein n=1 Tax=Angiostrongylus costaricensis TaxID=334426 RepID=A0A0R3PC90_ANGCS|nr:unnamed protein product [Angiostrongylus costaricensis]